MQEVANGVTVVVSAVGRRKQVHLDGLYVAHPRSGPGSGSRVAVTTVMLQEVASIVNIFRDALPRVAMVMHQGAFAGR